jgi:hypothetical protein
VASANAARKPLSTGPSIEPASAPGSDANAAATAARSG